MFAGAIVGKFGQEPFARGAAYLEIEAGILGDFQKAAILQGEQGPACRILADIEGCGGLSNAVGDLPIVGIWASVAPRYFDVDASGDAIETLLCRRPEHIFPQGHKRPCGNIALPPALHSIPSRPWRELPGMLSVIWSK
jgi:hypothetical protein